MESQPQNAEFRINPEIFHPTPIQHLNIYMLCQNGHPMVAQ